MQSVSTRTYDPAPAAARDAHRGAVVLVARVLDRPRADVEFEYCDSVAVLVGDQQPLPGRVEREVTRGFAWRHPPNHLRQDYLEERRF